MFLLLCISLFVQNTAGTGSTLLLSLLFPVLTVEQDLVRCQGNLVCSLLQRVSILSRQCCKLLYLSILKESSNKGRE